MNGKENPAIIMSWSCESYVSEYNDPDDLIYETSGNLFSLVENDDKECIGKFRIYYVDVERARNERESIFYVLDSHSSHLAEYYLPIFDSKENIFNNQLLEEFDHQVFGSNLLVVDRLEILPEHRGKRNGLTVLAHLIRRFSHGAGIVAMKPFPLQFEAAQSIGTESSWLNMMGLDQLSKDNESATEKLCKYYGKLGFVHLKGTPIMVFSTAYNLPSIEDTLSVDGT